MKTTLQRIDDLSENLFLIDTYEIEQCLNEIKKSYHSDILRLTPKKRISAKPKVKDVPYEIELIENGKSTKIIFENEAKLDAFLKLKKKQRLQTHSFPAGLTPPYDGQQFSRALEYKDACLKYWQAAEEQNLTLTVKIQRC